MIEDPATAKLPLITLDERHDLKTIRRPNNEAVIWNRVLPRGVEEWLARVKPEYLPTARYVLPTTQIEACLEALFDSSGMMPSPQRTWLIKDIEGLGKEIGAIFSASHVRLRVEAVTGDACRRFHIDTVPARMVCTYRGPGTEYGISDEGVDPLEIYHLPLGLPMLFKGLLWEGQHTKQLKHRSPPISGSGITRFVVVMEPASADPDELTPYDSIFDA